MKKTFWGIIIYALSIALLMNATVSVAVATEIPSGQYKVGEDIPAGNYTISYIKKNVNLTVFGSEFNNYTADGGLLVNVLVENDNPRFEKVVLSEGNVIGFNAPIDITKYKGLDFDPSAENTVYGGQYTIGEDIPAGSYSVSGTGKTANFTVWGAGYQDYMTNGGLLVNALIDNSNPSLGKVVLEDGNIIYFTAPLVFKPFKGLSFDNEEEDDTAKNIISEESTEKNQDDSDGLSAKQEKITMAETPTSMMEATESGEIKSQVSDLGTTTQFLFQNNQKRALCLTMLVIDLSDSLGNGPLDLNKLGCCFTESASIGITKDEKSIIVICPYDGKESTIVIDYNPKGVINYYIYNYQYLEALDSLFLEYNIKEHYEILPDEVIAAFKSLGINVSAP